MQTSSGGCSSRITRNYLGLDSHNSTGRPLSSPEWLEAHHRAKLRERRRFAASLASYAPTRVLDLGCATGLWLDVLDGILPPECEFIGIDSDPESLRLAESLSRTWGRKSDFLLCDIQSDPDRLPGADLTLAFNLFPYLHEPGHLLECLNARAERGIIAIRQYDGAALRFGPMHVDLRSEIESSLRASMEASTEFSHYDMDRAFSVIQGSRLAIQSLEFELFQRTTPYEADFVDYYSRTIAWTLDHISDQARTHFLRWLTEQSVAEPSQGYFWEVDLTAVLS